MIKGLIDQIDPDPAELRRQQFKANVSIAYRKKSATIPDAYGPGRLAGTVYAGETTTAGTG
jgi:hypothetical protein